MDKLGQLHKEYERNMEKAQNDFGDTLNDVIRNADITLR